MSLSLICVHVACRVKEIALSDGNVFFKALWHVNKVNVEFEFKI